MVGVSTPPVQPVIYQRYTVSREGFFVFQDNLFSDKLLEECSLPRLCKSPLSKKVHSHEKASDIGPFFQKKES